MGFANLQSVNAAITLLSKDLFDAFASYVFTVFPLFVLMGQVAFNSGLSEKLYKTARKFIGYVLDRLTPAMV